MATEVLLTAEEFLRLPDEGQSTELVRGRVVEMPPPGWRHGRICLTAGYLIQRFLDENDVGRVVTNDSGIVTERDPDTVRGADVSYYSYERLPREEIPVGYPSVSPDAAIEVMSPGDTWPEMTARAGEFLAAGATVVVVLHPEHATATIYRRDTPPRTLASEEELSLEGALEGFRVAVKRFFE